MIEKKMILISLCALSLLVGCDRDADKSKLNSFATVVRYRQLSNDNYDICVPEKNVKLSDFGLEDILVGDTLTVYYEGEIRVLLTYPIQYSYEDIEIKYIDQTKAIFLEVTLDSLSNYQDQTAGIVKNSDGTYQTLEEYKNGNNETIYITTDINKTISYGYFSYQAR